MHTIYFTRRAIEIVAERRTRAPRGLTCAALLAATMTLVGCATTESSPSPSAAGTQASRSFEQVYDTALKAMLQMGRIESEDHAQGIITGVTPSGVTLEIEIVQHPGQSPDIQVQARVPEGMAALGDITEPDRYLDIYRRLAK